MLSRLSSTPSRTLLRRSFAAAAPPPPAARFSRTLVLGGLSVGIALGGYLLAERPATAIPLFAAPLLLDSSVSTPKSTEQPIPAPPPSTTATPGEHSSQIGKGPVVEGRESADRVGGSSFNDTDVAGDNVGGHKPEGEQGEPELSAEGSAKDGEGEGVTAEGEEPRDPKTMGAFNEETGEINWDCPCLGGMPHGPCGEEFRAAFSCFVYSEQEPKGIECVEKFKGMQDCFRAHPEVYGESDYEDEGAEPSVEAEQSTLEPLEQDLKEDPSRPFRGEDDERGELFAKDGGVTGEGIGHHTE